MQAPEGKSYVRGHGSRMASYREARAAKRMKIEPVNPSGLCMCGCGQPVPRATADKPTRGYRKGDFVTYLSGHATKTGSGNPGWKGGRTIRWGYAYAVAHGHPKADKDGYVLEHRLVVEKREGRFLERDEHVHHINRNKLDNRPENLMIMSKHDHHMEHRDSIPNWRATITPEELRARCQAAGRKGAEARWSQKSPSAKPPKP